LWRKFERVAVRGDPFQAHVSDEKYLGVNHYGVGDTPDAAVLAAIPRDLKSALRTTAKRQLTVFAIVFRSNFARKIEGPIR
jgi:hypothetical protein